MAPLLHRAAIVSVFSMVALRLFVIVADVGRKNKITLFHPLYYTVFQKNWTTKLMAEPL